ncbi:hypothetical protein D9M72_572710 [compost metagenome]
MAAGELGGVLALEAVRQVQALALLGGVEQQDAGVAAAFDVGQAQQLAALEHEGGVAAAGDGFLVEGRAQGKGGSHVDLLFNRRA